jgi:methionine synthase I (cobalamin-dependent)
MVETNSFNGARVSLAEYGLQHQAYELNKGAGTHLLPIPMYTTIQ